MRLLTDFVKVWEEVEMSHFLRLDAYSCYQVRKNKKWVIYGFLLQQTYMLHKQYMYNVLRKTPVPYKLNLLLHWKFLLIFQLSFTKKVKIIKILFVKLNYGTPRMTIYGAQVNRKWARSEPEVGQK